MRTTSAGVAIALTLAPLSAFAKDPPSEPLRASLEVEAEGTLEEEGLRERVDTALGARLRRAEVLPRKTLQDGLIHVELEPLPKGEGYHYDVYAERSDKTLDETITRADCTGCDEAALLEAVGAAVDKCLPALAAASQPAPSAEPPPPEVQPTTEAVVDDPRPGLGGMGKAGVGLIVAGAATAVVGVIFVVQGRAFDTRPGALEQRGSDFRPPGYGLLAGGAASLITGAILVGVDRKRRKQEASVAFIPGGAVATIGGRF